MLSEMRPAEVRQQTGSGRQDGRERLGVPRRKIMNPSTERAVLAGGCFWGMQDLIRRYPGVVSTRVGYSGGDVPNATYRNHGTHAEAIEIIFDPATISYRQIARVFLPDPRSDDAEPPRQRRRQRAIARRSSTPATSRSGLPKTRSPTSMLPGFGPARWSPKSLRPATSGRPSRSIRTTSRRIPHGYTCHFVRPNWKLPGPKRSAARREQSVTS